MSDSYFFRIIASSGIFFEGKVEAVLFKTIDGEMELMAHHEEMIIAVEVGPLSYKTPDGEWHKVIVGVGTAQFANNRCTALVDTCELPENIDRLRAEQALERAQEQMRQRKSIVEYKMSQASLARALTRLKESSKNNLQ
ncbi:MAG: ATP synthase F1 subunit epsilon [Lachnospiraceae bacterium]|nr:ATP synthase F1 subunit epsilon [Lachnospiraceae bacterium]MDN4744596.1 ATP synthase F1 subunit epsilon [Lachnospiraceae bacterium C1.1]